MRFLKKGEKKTPKSASETATKAHPDLKVVTGFTNFWAATPTTGISPTATTATKHHITKYQV